MKKIIELKRKYRIKKIEPTFSLWGSEGKICWTPLIILYVKKNIKASFFL
jgi:hypothetical protein